MAHKKKYWAILLPEWGRAPLVDFHQCGLQPDGIRNRFIAKQFDSKTAADYWLHNLYLNYRFSKPYRTIAISDEQYQLVHSKHTEVRCVHIRHIATKSQYNRSYKLKTA